jgi:hypothetical protein
MICPPKTGVRNADSEATRVHRVMSRLYNSLVETRFIASSYPGCAEAKNVPHCSEKRYSNLGAQLGQARRLDYKDKSTIGTGGTPGLQR